MSETELRDQYIARLEADRDAWRAEAAYQKADRDRLVAGCLATADWLDHIISQFVYISDKSGELRRLFLPPVRYGDDDTMVEAIYGEYVSRIASVDPIDLDGF